jgi:transcriptional regulator with XRE-family HTH domain
MKKSYLIPRPYVTVGDHLSKRREAKGLTQREVSLKLGYSSAQFVSNFERGIALPPLKKLRVLIKLYDMNVHEVMEMILASEKAKLLDALKGKTPKATG